MKTEMRYGGIELGGTKIVMAAADENLRILSRQEIPTEDPDTTLEKTCAFFRENPVQKMGLASFGPLDLNKKSSTYGAITSTPKTAWKNVPLKKRIEAALQLPCALDTDVNAAVLCEATMGAGKGLKNCVYITVGTGIGGGILCEGNLVHGGMHPEVGHMLLSPRADDAMPDGCCPYHKGCLEGLASGPAIEKRWGRKAQTMEAAHPAWDLEAYYLAQMCVTFLALLSPEKIILGGGVMHQSLLFPLIRKKTADMLNGYLLSGNAVQLDHTIVPPECFPDSGLLGALLLAKEAE